MTSRHPFRFGIQGDMPPQEWLAHAARAESLGYDVLSVGEHVFTHLAPLPVLTAAAVATSTIRLGTATLANDFRNPVVLARDIATLDALSGGRVEFGLGTGFFKDDYAQFGVSFDPPGTRIDRFMEAVGPPRSAFHDDQVDHSGTHYRVRGLSLVPRPHGDGIPLLIGGGGKRMLRFAGRNANIVSINCRTTASGELDWKTIPPDATAGKIAWVREAAGDRFDQLELHWLVNLFAITDDPEAAVHAFLEAFREYGPVDITVEEALTSPHILVGTEDEIVDAILQRRETYGVSYVSVFAGHIKTFAPIIARLKGT